MILYACLTRTTVTGKSVRFITAPGRGRRVTRITDEKRADGKDEEKIVGEWQVSLYATSLMYSDSSRR